MNPIRNVLVAVREASDARIALEKATRLIRACSERGSPARLHVVRVIYEGIADLGAAAIDGSAGLKSFMLEVGETLLEELVEPVRGRGIELETVTLWNPRSWAGVLHAAERVEADVVMQAVAIQPGSRLAVRTPDEWNLLRHARVPVLLLKEDAWPAEPVVLCALDVFDPNHETQNPVLLERARQLADLLGGALDVVVAYPLFEQWVGELGAVQGYEALKRELETEIRARVVATAARAGVDYRRLVADEGHATQVIDRLVEDAAAQIVVLGTHARAGLQGILLGNTSERVLQHVQADVMTVPGPA